MKELVIFCKPEFEHSDERGSFYQLCSSGWSQFNVFFTKKNMIRGGHYHKHNKESFFVIKGEVKISLSSGDNKKEILVKTGDYFCIPPFVTHSMYFIADTYLASMYDIGVVNSDGSKDIYEEI